MTCTRLYLLGTAAVVCCLAAPVEAASQVRRFDVPAQPARTGIPLFAHQAGIQILASGPITDGVRINSVKGSMEVSEALRRLLEGTDLIPVPVGRAIMLKRQGAGMKAVRPAAFADASPTPGLQGQAATAEDAPLPQEPPEDIVVTGIRASLQESINVKRAAGNIVDVITAQDIGKLPDQNVAESMSRITGVQITRFEGEGSGFTVRGISQNRLEINGRTFLGPGAGAAASLESLSPEVIAGIVVSKTPTADMPEGALGATVNLKTKRPLDLKPFVVSGRAQGIYTDQADKLGYRGSALVSAHLTDTLGVLATAAYSKVETLGYAFDTGGWTRTDAIDGNGDGVPDKGLFRPNRLMENIQFRDQRRFTLNGAIQYQPTDRWNIVFDATYSKLDEDRTPVTTQILLNNNVTGAVADEAGTVVSGTYNGVTVRPLIYNAPTVLKSTNLGMSTSYKGSVVEVSADASYSRGQSSPAAGSSLTYVMVQRDGRTANVGTDFGSRRAVPGIALNTNYDALDISQYRLTSVFDGAILTDNDGYDGRVDFKIHTDYGPLSSIEVGSRYESLHLYSEAPQSVPGAASLLARGDRNGDGILTVDELAGVSYGSPVGYYPGIGGAFPGQVLNGYVDPATARDYFGLPTPQADTIPLGRVSIKDVQQDTLAFYVKGNFEGELGSMRLTGNAGIRYASQQRLSSGYLSDTQPAAAKSNFDFWLPSANATLEFTDKLSLRLAAAKVMARPSLSDVAISFVPLLVSRTGSRGNPNLRPFQATQYDASLEWYFAPSSALTAAVFYKDVDSFTINRTESEYVPGISVDPTDLFQITQPVNGESGKIKGFEIAYQQALRFLPKPFDNLGVQANYTYVDSKTPLIDEATGSRLPLPGLSKHSYNLIGYYEDKTLSLRAAYIYRSSFLAGQGSAAAGGSTYSIGRGQLDLSGQLNLTKQVRLIVEAINVTKEKEGQYLQEPTRLLNSAREDRRIFFGAAVTF